MTIHKEGYVILIVLFIILATINLITFYYWSKYTVFNSVVAILSIIIFLLVLQFFRNPKITPTKDETSIIAPADGKVVVIENVYEKEYFKGERKQISIFMSPINVHVNRNPVSGKVKFFKYHPGEYLVAWHPKSSELNERTTMVIEHPNGKEVLVRQIAGAVARRICWYVNEGDSIKQAEEFGFIKFGSRIDLFVPLDAEVTVKMNEVTKGGRTVLAKW